MQIPKGIKQNKLADGSYSYKVTIYGGSDPVTNRKLREYHTFQTLKEAVAFQKKRKSELSDGYSMAFSTMLFSDAFRVWYHTYKKEVSPAAWKSYDYTQRKLATMFPGVQLGQLTRSQLQGALNKLGRDGYSHESQRKLLNRVKQFTRAMMYEGALLRDPAIDISLNGHRGKDGHEMVWSVTTYQKALTYWEGLSFNEHSYQDVPTWLAAVTGMRVSEVLGLSFDNMFLDEAAPFVRVAQSYVNVTKELGPLKSRSAYRDIPIPPRVVKRLRLYKAWVQQVNFASGYRDPDNLAFRRIDHSMPSSGVLNAYFKRFQEKVLGLGIGDQADERVISYHGLRHTYISYLFAQGIDPAVISRIAGHANVNITLSVYTAAMKESMETGAKIAIDSLEAL